MDVTDHTISVERTARYCLLGDPSASEHLFVLHGYGQRAGDFVQPFQDIASADRCVIAPEALSRFYTDDLGDHREVGASWMTRADREHEIRDYVAYLDRLAEHVTPDGSTPPARTVLGFSQGAATASRWALLGTAHTDRLVLWAGAPGHDLDLAAHADRLRALAPTLVAGTDDPWVTDDRIDAARRALTAHDVPLDLVRFDGGHRLHRATLRQLFPPDLPPDHD